MAAQLQLSLDIDDLFKLVDQLSPQERERLAQYLDTSAEWNPLTIAEKLTLLDSITFDVPLVEGASYRREDWYSDDGR